MKSYQFFELRRHGIKYSLLSGLIFLLFFSGDLLKAQHTGWTEQTSGTNVNLNGISFVDENTGWVVGNRDFFQGNITQALRTTDGGRTWELRGGSVSELFHDVHAFDANTVVAIGSFNIYRTTNGGSSWSVVEDERFNAVAFADNNIGVAVGNFGRVYRTTNGGISWSQRSISSNDHFFDVAFSTATDGNAVGRDNEFSFMGARIRTTNAGFSWSNQTQSDRMNGIDFADENVGVAVGVGYRIIRTTSGGSGWTPIPDSDTGVEGTNMFHSTSFGSSTVGYAVGDNAVIVKSTDAGLTWTQLDNPLGSQALRAVYFTDEFTGTVTSNNGHILRTTTGGVPAELAVSGGAYSNGGDFTPGSVNNVILRFEQSINVGGKVIFDEVEITTGGDYSESDIEAFRLWADDSETFDANTAALLDTQPSTTGNGETIVFENVSREITESKTRFFVTVDFDAGASSGAVSGQISSFSDLDYSVAGTLPNSDNANSFPIAGDELSFSPALILSELTVEGEEGWRMMSSPVEGATYAELLSGIWTQGFPGTDFEGGAPNVLLYEESSQSWSAPSNLNDTADAGRGFIVFIFENDEHGVQGSFPKSLSVENVPRSGAISLPLLLTLSGNGGSTFEAAVDGWNLVGNPYVSPIDWDEVAGWNRAGLTNSIYIWDHQENNYLSWNGTTGSLGSGKVAAWQSFWVKADNSETPSLSVDEDAITTNVDFRKHATDATPIIELKLSDSELHTSTFIMLHEEATVGLNGYDAFQLDPLSADYLLLYTVIEGGHALDINALPAGLETEQAFPLVVGGSNLNGELTLQWAPRYLPEGWMFELRDLETGETHSLSEAGEYRFTKEKEKTKPSRGLEPLEGSAPNPRVAKAKDTEESRFTIHISPGAAVSTETEPELPETYDLVQNYPNPFNPVTIIGYQLPENSEVRLEVFDMLGRRMATLVNERMEAGVHEVAFDASHLSSGVYLYRLQAGSHVLTRKLTLIK